MKLKLALLLTVTGMLLNGCVVVVGNPLGLFQRDQTLQETTLSGHGSDKIAVIGITGILTDTPGSAALGLVEKASTLARVDAALRKAGEDPHVKALILRIDSPGGSVAASDEIYSRIQRFKTEHHIPVIALLGGIAASGGYYVACSADRIVAEPATVTGSIGVILVSFNVQGLLDKLGIEGHVYTAGEHKDILSPLREATPQEQAMVQQILDSLHARFIHVVTSNRPALEQSRLSELTDGRVFDAAEAVQTGLVDQIGHLPDAIDAAKHLAGLSEARVIRYRRPGETHDSIYSAYEGGKPRAAHAPLGIDALAGGGSFLYLWPNGLSGAGIPLPDVR